MNSSFSHFESQQHCFLGSTKTVYSIGSGPIIVLLHEIPNIIPEVFDLALRLSQHGFRVYLPEFFGAANRSFSLRASIKEISLGCIRKEFAVFAQNQCSPVVDWLRALCTHVLAQNKQEKLAMIGMCFTGNFALGLIAEDFMAAPVLSQPSLPYAITPSKRAALHVSPDILRKAKERKDLSILGLRFSHDWMCPRARFKTLEEEFGSQFQGIEIDSSPGNAHGISTTAHSVLSLDFVDQQGHPTKEAFDQMLGFIQTKLSE